MSKIKPKNNKTYPIADFATPSAFAIRSASASDIAPQLTRENLAKVQFLTDGGLVSGIYTDKQLVSCTQSGEDVAVVICDRYDIVIDVGPDNRVTGVRYPKFADYGDTVVDKLPDGDPLDYKYVDGQFVYDPLPKPPAPEPEPGLDERVNKLEGRVDNLETGYAAEFAALDAEYTKGGKQPMIDQQTRKQALYNQGRADAQALQGKAASMDGTQLNGEAQKIPDFQAAKKAKNMLKRPVGFVCQSSAGRVVKLLQVYDSDTYPGEPEELPAQWGFVWSKDPTHAKPFVAISTSPYMIGDCCIEGGTVWVSTMDNNVHAPSAYPQGWRRADEPEPEPQPEPQPEAPAWKQPTGGHDAYKKGDKVTHKGKIWVSTADANVWEPGVYGWEEAA